MAAPTPDALPVGLQIFKTIVDLVSALVWPAVVVVLVICYRKTIKRFAELILTRATELLPVALPSNSRKQMP